MHTGGQGTGVSPSFAECRQVHCLYPKVCGCACGRPYRAKRSPPSQPLGMTLLD